MNGSVPSDFTATTIESVRQSISACFTGGSGVNGNSLIGQSFFVSADGGDNTTAQVNSFTNMFATIQDAMALASSGDTVFVYPGDYYGDVELKNGVILTNMDANLFGLNRGGLRFLYDVVLHGSFLNNVSSPADASSVVKGFRVLPPSNASAYKDDVTSTMLVVFSGCQLVEDQAIGNTALTPIVQINSSNIVAVIQTAILKNFSTTAPNIQTSGLGFGVLFIEFCNIEGSPAIGSQTIFVCSNTLFVPAAVNTFNAGFMIMDSSTFSDNNGFGAVVTFVCSGNLNRCQFDQGVSFVHQATGTFTQFLANLCTFGSFTEASDANTSISLSNCVIIDVFLYGVPGVGASSTTSINNLTMLNANTFAIEFDNSAAGVLVFDNCSVHSGPIIVTIPVVGPTITMHNNSINNVVGGDNITINTPADSRHTFLGNVFTGGSGTWISASNPLTITSGGNVSQFGVDLVSITVGTAYMLD